MTAPTHYVHCNCNGTGAIFVKEAGFFESQGGLTADWGKAWKPVVAKSIIDAREEARKVFGDEDMTNPEVEGSNKEGELVEQALSDWNDSGECSFKQIADMVEAAFLKKPKKVTRKK